MIISNKLATRGLVFAGMMNIIGVLLFSRCFTNETIPQVDPIVMSNFGLLMIVIWGLAYISVAQNYINVPYLIAVFALEKTIYGVIWIRWLLNNSLDEVYNQDFMAGIYYTIYGLNDWLFSVFFLLLYLQRRSVKID